MDMRYVLALGMLMSAFIAGVWDVYMIANGKSDDTVSRTLHEWSLLYPILPLAIGILFGHIFWPQVGVRVIRD